LGDDVGVFKPELFNFFSGFLQIKGKRPVGSKENIRTSRDNFHEGEYFCQREKERREEALQLGADVVFGSRDTKREETLDFKVSLYQSKKFYGVKPVELSGRRLG